MNLRIENQNLRFKITEDELLALLEQRFVDAKVSVLEQVFVVVLNPLGQECGTEMALKLDLGHSEVSIALLIPMEKLQQLADMGKSRAGLSCDIDGVSVSLQVDVRVDTRKIKRT